MPYRTTPFVNGQIYHIYNRGTEKRTIFEQKRDYQRFMKTLAYYQLEGPKPKLSHFIKSGNFKKDTQGKIVQILAYCLMPNHFHLMVKQLREGGVSEMVSKLSLSYTKYYNTKFDRVGPLLQGQFKAVLVDSDEQLIHLSRYIHLNPIASFLIKDLEDFEWSSYGQYVQIGEEGICSTEEVLSFFKSPLDYKNFVLDQIDYSQKLEQLKHKLLE